MLGALLLAGVVDNDVAKPPLPAGGGTFDGTTQHADARQADSVNRWSHVALTYDGKALRLYENAIQVSSRAETGSILKTTDPLWIGGNHPYGEYFHGLIDEARVYDRGLTPSEIRAEMSTPIRSGRITPAAGLVVRGPSVVIPEPEARHDPVGLDPAHRIAGRGGGRSCIARPTRTSQWPMVAAATAASGGSMMRAPRCSSTALSGFAWRE